MEQAIFRAPFLAASPSGVSRVDPGKGCSVAGNAAGSLFCSSPRVRRLNRTLPPIVPV